MEATHIIGPAAKLLKEKDERIKELEVELKASSEINRCLANANADKSNEIESLEQKLQIAIEALEKISRDSGGGAKLNHTTMLEGCLNCANEALSKIKAP